MCTTPYLFALISIHYWAFTLEKLQRARRKKTAENGNNGYMLPTMSLISPKSGGATIMAVAEKK
jgi:hypothetical protein